MKKLKAEIRKMRAMRPGEALDYFWTYYKIHLMFVAIAVFFLVLILQANHGKRTELVFSALLVDTGISQTAADRAAAAFSVALGLDPETQEARLDTSVAVKGGTVANLETLLLQVAAGEVDVLLTDPDLADYELKGGALADLQAALDAKTLNAWADRLVYADAAALRAWNEARKTGEAEEVFLLSADPAGMETPVPVAIDVTALCAAVFGRPAELGQVLFSVAITTRQQERAGEFLAFLQTFAGAAA